MNIFIEIGGKPVAKGRGRVGRILTKEGPRATVFTPAKTRSYENLIKAEAHRVMNGQEPIAGPVEVTIFARLPYPKSLSKAKLADAKAGRIKPVTKPDIDNYVKAALDGINSIVIVDDNQVVAVHAFKGYCERPRLTIEVSTWFSPQKKKATLEDLL